MIELLQASLGRKAKDPSRLVSHAGVEMIARGSFSGQNLPLMTVGELRAAAVVGAPPQPPQTCDCAALAVTPVLPPVHTYKAQA